MGDLLEIYTLGGLAIKRNGLPLTGLASRKEEALLVYLACTCRSHSRESLAELLWEERTQTQSLANLRGALSRMGQALGPHLTVNRHSVAFNQTRNCRLDAAELEKSQATAQEVWTQQGAPAAVAQLEEAVTLYRGDFLLGFRVRDCPGFEEWVTVERERLRQFISAALRRLVNYYLEQGRLTAGIEHARRLLLIDPLLDEAHQQLMLLLARSGQRHAALKQYENYRQLLAAELDVAPSGETSLLHEEIRAGRVGTVVTATESLEFKPSRSSAVWQPANPYKGLRAFRQTDADDFFGREALTDRLAARIASSDGMPRFLAVIGPSGSGKSSVISAGLLPALQRSVTARPKRWAVVEMVPGPYPFEELEAGLLRIAVNPPTTLLSQLREDERGLVRAAKRVLPDDDAVELLLLIDQFEEVFTLVDDEYVRSHFLNSLHVAVVASRSRVHVVIALRADFTDRPLEYAGFGELVRQQNELVLPLMMDELRAAIVRPAERMGVALEPDLVAALVKDVGEQRGVLPFLQYTLTELFDSCQGRTMTLADYRSIGGLLGSLTRRADALYNELDAAGQETARQLFLRLVTLGQGVEDTRRRVQRTELASIAASEEVLSSIVDLFGRFRLLTFDIEPLTHLPTVEIAHEALIRAWDRLRNWLDTNREDLLVQRRLNVATREWVVAEHDPSFLASGARLEQFEALAAGANLALNAEERQFLQVSLDEQQRRVVNERDRHTRELRLQRRAAQQLRYLVGALTIFLAIAAGLTVFAFSSRTEAVNSAVTATVSQGQALDNAETAVANLARSDALRMAAEASSLVASGSANAELAALLAIRSLNAVPSEQAEAALSQAIGLTSTAKSFVSGASIQAVAYSPDGHTILTGDADGVLQLWDVQSGQRVRVLTERGAGINGVAFSPDGAFILTGLDDGHVQLWDAETGQHLHDFAGHHGAVWGVTFSQNGMYVLAGGSDGNVLAWRVDEEQSKSYYTAVGEITDVAFSPDGTFFATGGQDRAGRLWDTGMTGAVLKMLLGHTSWVLAVAISPDSRTVLTGSIDSTARLWDVETGECIRTFVGHGAAVIDVAFSPDGRSILTGSYDNTARLWDVETGQTLRVLYGHTAAVMSVAFSPDGRYVLTGSQDGMARLWEAIEQPHSRIFWGHSSWVTSVAFSPDGMYILTGSFDLTARLWDAQSGRLIRTFEGHTNALNSVAFSPDGQYVVTSSADYTARIWRVDTGERVQTLGPQGTNRYVMGAAFSPDGKYVATASEARTARLWLVSTGELIRAFQGHTDAVNSVAWSPDQRYVVTSSVDGTARLWQAGTGTQVQQYVSQSGVLLSAVVSPGGEYVLTGSRGGVAELWELESGRLIRTMGDGSAPVTGVAFSPDGRTILTAGGEGMASLWDVQTGQHIHSYGGHTGPVQSVAFSPDGRYVLTGSADGTARLWDVDYRDLIRLACTRIFRDFTDQDRVRYGIADRTPTCPHFGVEVGDSSQ